MDRGRRSRVGYRLRRVVTVSLSVLMMATGLTIVQSLGSDSIPSAEARGGGVGGAPFSLPQNPNADRFGGVNCPSSTVPVKRLPPGYVTPDPVPEGYEPPLYDATITTYNCEWWEREWRNGSGVWQTRPELISNDFGGVFVTRGFPSFNDVPIVRTLYYASKAGEAYLQDITINPSTISSSLPVSASRLHPCMFKAMNGDPAIQVSNGLEFDKIEWAQAVSYRLEHYMLYRATYVIDSDPYYGSEYFSSGPSSRTLGRPNFESNKPFSKITWLSCSGAGLGGEAGVTVLCPVEVTKVVITGPTGVGLPSRSEINEFAEQTKKQKIDNIKGIPQKTPFAKKLKSLKNPRKDSQNASAAIAEVKKCQNGDQAKINVQLPSPGNYDFSVTMDYVACSYSILPGFSNNTFFGGCQQTPTVTKTHTYTSNAKCDGVLVNGKNGSYDFAPEACYSPTCQWKPGEGNKVVIDNPVGATGDEAPLEKKIVNPRNDRAFASGVPTLWSIGLNQMTIAAKAGLGAPKRVGGTKYSVFEIQKDSTPWNPKLARNEKNVNHSTQYFASYSEDGSKKGVLSLLPSLTKPKDGEERVPEWEGMLLSAYNSSAVVSGSPKPFIVRIHRNEGWILPTRVPFVSAVGIFGTTGGTPKVAPIQQAMTCSSAPFFQSNGECQGCVSYVSNRLIPVAR